MTSANIGPRSILAAAALASPPALCQPPSSVPPLSSTPPEDLLEDLGARRLLIVSGKGGVGRTTVAALLGSALAARGKRVLIATTGHDDRLAWMLGGERLRDSPVEVSPNLEIQRLSPATCVEEYGALVTRSQRISHAVFGNKVVRRLLRAIPGLDDFAILGKVWHEACRARSVDTLIFDGPASGHLRLVLGVPQAIVEAVSEGPLTREAVAMRDALRDPEQCAAVLVGLAEPWPLTELGELALALRRELGIDLGAIVVNKLWPLELAETPTSAEGPEGDDTLATMLCALDELRARGRDQQQTVHEWLAERGPGHDGSAMVTIPWWPWGVESPEQLERLLERIEQGGDAADG
ncbi:ArsA family ATPase [Pseudenhygromyxa sp. WMMC2535]|uniref:ArsA family ATPase n=1 Tax=Pseudenhygromyxa sp. WMMC2535 TaxID=2712867 RepID=UPI0015535F35|nr:ArsA family ATPase [Pseudenhygromyxa sp. WMMC2535]NVB38838.1 ArsA family ATPase [Pseudenhygromyxa sp. WMMC2535]